MSPFKLSCHSLSLAKCSARRLQCRKEPICTQNAIIHLILTENDHNFLPDRAISTFKGTNCCILREERGACRIKLQDKTNKSQGAIIRRFQRKMSVISSPLEICRRLNSHVTPCHSPNVVHDAFNAEKSPFAGKTRSFI
jgi:hypothetical protein